MQPQLTHPDDRESLRQWGCACRHSWQIQARIVAQRNFDRILRHGWVNRLRDAVRSRSSNLICLTDITPPAAPGSEQNLGLQSIPLTRICGSEGRAHDFDRHFAPLHEHIRERWVSLAALRSAGHALPPVDLVQIGERYFILDGHHRISIAHAFGDTTIEAYVTRWPDRCS
ncbi:MAG: ParB N-terminal domain-containing protein [Oscillochloris sp.]|nr:ParB N-terminal domain-containing protein [Oscillochloris sp.]